MPCHADVERINLVGGERMGQFIENLQYKLKTSSSGLLLMLFKCFIGFMLGLTFALIGAQIIGYGKLAFFLMIVATMATFYRISRGWKWGHATVFAFVCVLLALLLRMYILMAPGI